MAAEFDSIVAIARRSEEADSIRRILGASGIPFTSGLLGGDSPRIVFSVSRHRLEEARRRLAAHSPLPGPERAEDAAERDDAVESEPAARQFPWREVRTLSALIAFHLVLVLLASGPHAVWPGLAVEGGVSADALPGEPWRLLTSLFLHADPPHVLWNGVSLLVFGVPLLTIFGVARTALLYLVAGIGGAVTAWALAGPGTVVIGSSGAVAGLFGAWVVWNWRRSPGAVLPSRSRLRTLGIALLVLPSLISPESPEGRAISVSSHLGGMATGMALGAVLSGALARKRPE